MAPILKWAGGKTKLVPDVLAAAPVAFENYHEPFFGAGAIFFAFCRAERIKRAFLNDLNADLIALYECVRDDPEPVILSLRQLADAYLAKPREERASFYYQVRASKPLSTVSRAAWLIFLNKTCYNGLYRVNRKGAFNVPHGDYAHPRIIDPSGLLAASVCLQRADLSSVDFAVACRRAKEGDFVYLDPPYHPMTTSSNFTSYTADRFNHCDQIRLRDEFEDLTARGVAAVLSNSSHPFVADLYRDRGYVIERVLMARAINSAPMRRARIPELLISNRARPEVIRAFNFRPE